MNLLTKLQNPPVIFVGGKGGVGKTTTAAALAVRAARAGQKTLIISTDPAHSLGDALQQSLSATPKTICAHLSAVELDPNYLLKQHFAQIERTLTGYTPPDLMPKMREFLHLSQHAPGAEEAALLEAICRHLLNAKNEGFQRIIFDTAPTGHTLRLLSLPEMMQAWTDGLLAQQQRHRQLRHANENFGAAGILKSDEARWQNAFDTLNARRELFANARAILHDPAQTAIILVLIPETLPFLETERAIKQLTAAKLPCAGVVINQILPADAASPFWQRRLLQQQTLLATIRETFATLPQLLLPLQPEEVRGVAALGQLFPV